MSSDKPLSPWENPANWKAGVFQGHAEQSAWEINLLKEAKLALKQEREAKEAEEASKLDRKKQQDEKVRQELRFYIPRVREMQKMLKEGVTLGINTGHPNWTYLLGGKLVRTVLREHPDSFPVIRMDCGVTMYGGYEAKRIINDMIGFAPDYYEVKFGLHHAFQKVLATHLTPEDLPNIPDLVLQNIAKLEQVK